MTFFWLRSKFQTAKGILTDKYPNANLEWISGLTYVEVVVVAIGSDRLFRKLYRE